MSYALGLIVGFISASAGSAAFLYVRARTLKPTPAPDPTWLEARTLSRIIAHTTDDQSIEGLLDHVGDDGITLRAAKLLGEHPVEMSGETWVPRSKVLFVQTVPDPAP